MAIALRMLKRSKSPNVRTLIEIRTTPASRYEQLAGQHYFFLAAGYRKQTYRNSNSILPIGDLWEFKPGLAPRAEVFRSTWMSGRLHFFLCLCKWYIVHCNVVSRGA